MPSQEGYPTIQAEGYPTIHCATHEKPFPCSDCVAARLPSQSLPDGVEVWRIFKHTKPLYPNHAHVAVHGPDTDEIRVVRLSDLPKIEEQVRQQVREELEKLPFWLTELKRWIKRDEALATLDHKGDTDA